MKKDISYSSFFKNYGIFVAFLIIIFGILIYFSSISKKSWKNNLKYSVEVLLNEKEPDSWSIGNFNPIKSPISQNAVCYEAKNKKNGENYKAVLIRVQTLYGPLAAVFVVDKDNNVSFKGYSSLHGRVGKQIENTSSNKRINYWKNKIPEIVELTK